MQGASVPKPGKFLKLFKFKCLQPIFGDKKAVQAALPPAPEAPVAAAETDMPPIGGRLRIRAKNGHEEWTVRGDAFATGADEEALPQHECLTPG